MFCVPFWSLLSYIITFEIKRHTQKVVPQPLNRWLLDSQRHKLDRAEKGSWDAEWNKLKDFDTGSGSVSTDLSDQLCRSKQILLRISRSRWGTTPATLACFPQQQERKKEAFWLVLSCSHTKCNYIYFIPISRLKMR